jgi:hypothetical protein
MPDAWGLTYIKDDRNNLACITGRSRHDVVFDDQTLTARRRRNLAQTPFNWPYLSWRNAATGKPGFFALAFFSDLPVANSKG